ncbi:MAG TPA: hypothetical protein VGP31_16555 [Planosporangium sp.]|nr:hypothetical protein [Planosporangium sp.]
MPQHLVAEVLIPTARWNPDAVGLVLLRLITATCCRSGLRW